MNTQMENLNEFFDSNDKEIYKKMLLDQWMCELAAKQIIQLWSAPANNLI